MAHLPERTLRIAERPVVAAATRLSSAKIGRNWAQAWQDEAWEMYDQVGELRFVANAHAGSIGQANVYVGEQTDARDVPQEVFDGVAAELFDMFGGSDANREELMRRIALQLFVAGDGWIVGVPPETFHDYSEGIPPVGRGLGDLTWLVLSVQEVQVRAGRIHLRMGDRARTVDDDDAVLIRVWRPHPRSWWEADSPVRANLPVLRELVGLTKHVSASIDSRLAGAGLLVLPQSVSVVGGIADTQDADPEADPFLADLMDAMLTPIKDRDAASAVVPMVVKVPDEVASQIGQGNLITFSTPFDEEAKELRDEAIRRLALGLDAPPELLLGMGSLNHWCVDEQTEVLTQRGWVGHDSIQVGDQVLALDHSAGVSEWKTVTDLYRADVVDEPMRLLESRTHSSLTTLGHRWPTVTPFGSRRWRTSEELNAYDGITTGAPVNSLPTVAKYDDSIVEVMGWLWTEGSRSKDGRFSIAQSHTVNPGNVARLRAALTAAFTADGFRERVQNNESSYGGPVTVFFPTLEASKVLDELGGKRPTFEFIDSLTLSQLHLFIDVSCMGDGHHWKTGHRDIWQRNPDDLDAYERACILAGYAVSRQPSHDGGTTVRALRSTNVRPVKAAEHAARTNIDGAVDVVVPYTGVVWCPTVQDHATYLARRSGRTFFTGNSGWLVDENNAKTHLGPALGLICNAITEAFLRPALVEAGVSDPDRFSVWYDMTNLTLRPDRSGQAFEAFDRGALSTEALRTYAGFEEADAPHEDPAVRAALELVQAQPSLLADPGLEAVVAQIRPVMDGNPGGGDVPVERSLPSDQGRPG